NATPETALAVQSSPSSPSSSTAQQQQRKRENGIPVVLMYGEHDWMDIAGGYAAEQKMNEEKEKALRNASAQEARADRGSAKVVVIKKAGHHVYLDNDRHFNEVMLEEMKETQQAERRRGELEGG
ncbi:hypothetical protein LTR04_003061, partial [Oleoguttula sp. CCFEE 6159]